MRTLEAHVEEVRLERRDVGKSDHCLDVLEGLAVERLVGSVSMYVERQDISRRFEVKKETASQPAAQPVGFATRLWLQDTREKSKEVCVLCVCARARCCC